MGTLQGCKGAAWCRSEQMDALNAEIHRIDEAYERGLISADDHEVLVSAWSLEHEAEYVRLERAHKERLRRKAA